MKFGKLGVLLLGASLCISTIPYTALAATNNDVANVQNQKVKTAAVKAKQDGESVKLYEEAVDGSDILASIPSLSSVTILEKGPVYTQINYTDEKSGNEWTGYVKSDLIVEPPQADDSQEKANETSNQSVDSETADDVKAQSKDKANKETKEVKDVVEKTSKTENVKRTAKPKVMKAMAQPKAQTFQGIGLKSPTKVYSDPLADANELKSYSQGTLLIYKTFNEDWYVCTVYIEGKPTTGYIKTSDVDVPKSNAKDVHGVALASTTKIYSKASRNSEKLKSYGQGSVLKYHEFVPGWYECTVYVNGKAATGYINADDVQVPVTSAKDVHGVALKGKTRIYSKASRNSTELKNYAQGSILKYHNFVSGWYECTVYLNGKATTGYINADDVDVPVSSAKDVYGIALRGTTMVYAQVSRSSKELKSYHQGTALKYHEYVSGWYECTVYINGKPVTGYINADDVQVPIPSTGDIHGIALRGVTTVYAEASENSKGLKSYHQGTVLKYHNYILDWYECTVYINGKPTTGYINAKDVEKITEKQESLHGPALGNPTYVYSTPSTSSSVLKSYKRGTVLKYKTYTSGWYECTVYINGKPVTGYIKAKATKGLDGRVIVIDPGHGGIDPGARGIDGTYEAVINLAYAKEVQKELNKQGVRVIMTRNGDKNCKAGAVGHEELQCRVDLSARYNADLYISIHANWVNNSLVRGVQTHFNDFNDPEYPGVNDYPVESKRLANLVQKEIVPALNERSDGIIDDNLYVTRQNTVPAILIELGFISNRLDLNNLKNNNTKKRFAKALSVALATYFESY